MVQEATIHGFNATAYDLEDYDYENDLINESLVVLLMATFGEGEPTDNAVDFMNLLCLKKLMISLLELNYAVFALGNRQYDKFL